MSDEGPRLVLHIGAMKTGTTYLQSRLTANSAAFAEQGWWVPEYKRVVQGVREILSTRGQGPAPTWAGLMDEARAWDGHGTVLSMEFLSYARRRFMPELVATWDGLDARVVLTVRDTVRALPSQWQTLTRNRFARSWPEFAEGVRHRDETGPAPGTGPFRRTQDVPRMISAWSRSVPKDRFHVLPVPGPSQPHELLWERFLGELDVDPATVPAPAAFDNPQLGYGTCELLRRVNAAGLNAEDRDRYNAVVRQLTHQHVDALREGQTRPRMDLATAEFAVAFNAKTLRAVGRKATLVGSPDDLPGTLEGHPVLDELDPGPLPAQVSDDEVLVAAGVLHRGAVDLCVAQGLDLPAELTAPLDSDVSSAVERVAAVLAVAMSGDVSHRPVPRSPPEDTPTVATEDDDDPEIDD